MIEDIEMMIESMQNSLKVCMSGMSGKVDHMFSGSDVEGLLRVYYVYAERILQEIEQLKTEKKQRKEGVEDEMEL